MKKWQVALYSVGFFLLILGIQVAKFNMEKKDFIGQECIIDKDTFHVVDYPIFRGTFYLDNGQEVSKYLVREKKINTIIGKKTIIGNDTATITNYDYFKRQYKLSNGCLINVENIYKMIID